MTDSCCRSVQRTAQRVVWAVVVLAAGTAAALAQQKAPVPDDAAQAKARELIRQIYGPQHDEAKNSVEKTALAKKMLNEAADDRDDPANHFVLLQVARDMAVQAADANTAMAAVDQIARTYQVDAPAMKVETLFQTAANASLSEQRKAVARAAIPLIRAAREEDDYETANRLVRKALDLARRARDGALLKQMVAINKQVGESAQAYAEVAKAEAVLADNPTDPEANLAVGRYLCLTKRDWEKGIAMLALGSDAHLKALAVKELEGAASAGEQVALGDAWWDLAQTRRGKEEESLLPRAGSWYRLAQPSVAGLVKVKIDRRLEEIGRMRMPIPDMPTQPLLPNGWVIGRPVNLGPTVNGRSDDAGPALSSDGLTLFFSSNRPGGKGRADLWMCTRASSDGPFDRAVNLGPTVNSSSHEARPALFSDGLALLFFSERSGGQGSRDLWMCTRESSDGPFGRPVNLGPTVNSSSYEGGPALSSDGLTLLFHSSRSGGKGSRDLWMCTRASSDGPFGRPVNLGPTVNSSREDGGPALFSDGLTLLFHSSRSGGKGSRDLW
ncbi:MAG: PD40 domain-containing protein, partial [Planctomycetes bacterium]|nr:PD40 domain-containing protein [Planctomycetota bacterium]